MEIKKVIEYFVHHKDWDYILVIIRETRKIKIIVVGSFR